MKTIKLLLSFVFTTTLFTSCHTEVVVDNFVEAPTITINDILNSHELWYVDINETIGFGEIPFLQKAFTISFNNGTVYANNNLVGIGNNGDGLGIDVANYNAFNMILDVQHDIDGFTSFDVFSINTNTIELYNPNTDTSYFLKGYQRRNFDYDFVFYDNIHYFLQEYEAWEKIYTSKIGALNEFDNENYLQFLTGDYDDTFRSSQDPTASDTNNLIWDYVGAYGISNITDNETLKILTLDYESFDNELFELSVINDETIELFHINSKTVYKFRGRDYIQFLKTNEKEKDKRTIEKKRKFKNTLKENPRTQTRI